MKREHLIVTTISGNRPVTRIWDTARPLGIGHPFRWLLERTPAGVRARPMAMVGGKLSDPLKIDYSDMTPARDHRLEDDLKLRVHPTRPVMPAFLSSRPDIAATKTALLQLFIFSGVRRSPIAMESVHAAYVAYAKSVPVFTVHQDTDGLQIKPLVMGVRLKFKGSPSIVGEPDKPWRLSPREFLGVTVTRGWYWWRFNLVEIPEALPKVELEDDMAEEKRWARRLLLLLLLLLFIGIGMKVFGPEEEIKVAEVPMQTVKIRPKTLPGPPKGTATATAGTGEKTGKVEVLKQKPQPPVPVVEKAPPKPQKVVQGPPPKKAAPPAVTPRMAAANMLRESFKTASASLSRTGVLDAPTKNANQGASIPTTSGKIGLAPTNIKPTYSGGDADVAGIGSGGGGPGGYGGLPGSAGYGSDVSGGVYKGAGGKYVSLDQGGSTVEEGLTKEEVGAVIHKHLDEIRYCHEASMLVDPKSAGKAVAAFRINGSGMVETASIQTSTLTEKGLGDCIIRKLKTWPFPRPKGGVKVSVSYPFLFRILGRE